MFQLMTKEIPANTSDNVSEVNEQLKRTMEDLSSVMREKEEISQRCHELDTQVSANRSFRSVILDSEFRLLDWVPNVFTLKIYLKSIVRSKSFP